MQNYLLKRVITAILLLMSLGLSAQFTASGVVQSADGTLPGVTVMLKGTDVGTITDIDGRFSIGVPTDDAVLVISYTGFETKEVNVSSANPTVTVELSTSTELLNEVVVVGYGTTTKEALTGAVATLKSDKLESVPLASMEQMLQGNIAGLQSNMGNGQPGANVQVRIRGQGSISASSEPLYVVDGIPMASGSISESTETSNPLATINPNDIASISVLKDASATAIYGARGANGVIVITTKSGSTGKPKVSLSVQYGFNDWATTGNALRGLTAAEYTDLYLEGELNRGRSLESAISRFNNSYPDPQTGLPAVDITPNADGTSWTLGEIRVDNRWIDQISRTGNNLDLNLNVSGGKDNVTYFASGGYFKQEAPIIGSSLDRFSGRAKIGVQVTDRLKISNNISLSRTLQEGMRDGTGWANPMYNGYLLAPVIPARDATGRFYGDHKSFFMGGNNPIGQLSGDDTQEWTMIRIMDNLDISYEIIDGLTFKSAWSFDMLNFGEFFFRNSRYGDGRNLGGYAAQTNRNNLSWIGTQTLNYAITLADNNNLDFLVGYEANDNTIERTTAYGEQFPPNPNLRTLRNAAAGDPAFSTEFGYSFASTFARASYNYDYRYYFNASLRRDGSSRFGANNRYGTFWSVGASWRMDQEPFLKDIAFIKALKLRTSYGTAGNAGIGNYDHQRLISFSDIDNQNTAYDGQPGGGPSTIGNSELTWESSTSFNIGVDFTVGPGIAGTVEYFNRESDNLLLDVPVSRTTGFRDAQRNFGAMRNSGVELSIDVPVINSGKFNWSIGGNLTFLKNKITKLDKPFRAGTHDRFLREEGRDYNEYNVYDWAGVNPDNGAPLWYTDESRTETTSDIREASRFFIGKSGTPDFYGGFNTSISYGNLAIDANFSTSWNNYLYDGTAWVIQGDGRFTPRSQTNLVLDRWQKPGDVTNVPKFQWGNRSNSNQRGSSRWIHDGTFVRLRNLTVGYNLPSDLVEKAGLSNTRIYFRGVNLLTWTRDKDLYLDPEADVNGFVNSPVPNMRTVSLGLNVGF